MKSARLSSLVWLCAGLSFVGYYDRSHCVAAEGESWPGRRTTWNGFDQFHFSVAERKCYVVVPKQAAPGNPWVW